MNETMEDHVAMVEPVVMKTTRADPVEQMATTVEKKTTMVEPAEQEAMAKQKQETRRW